MSDLINRYNNSQTPRVIMARQIPGAGTNYFDQPNTIQDELKTFPEHKRTRYSDDALNSFDERIQNFSLPEGFNRLQPDIPFNRWGPDNRYFKPGQPQS